MESRAPRNSLLAALSAEDRQALQPHLLLHDHDSGYLLFEAGEPITHVHFPIQGVVSLVTVMTDGAAIEVMKVGSEGAAGVAAGFGVRRSFARAIAQTPCRTLRIESGRFREQVERSPALRALMERYFEQQLAEAQQNAACNALHRLEARLAKWLLRCADRLHGDVLPLTQEFMSEMLGASRTTVTQIAQNLQQAGLIRYQRGRVEIVDRRGLERASCECYAAINARSAELGLKLPAGPVG